MWLGLLVVLILVCAIIVQRREGMSPNAYEMSQMQQGKIKKMFSDLQVLTFNRNELDEIEKCVKTNNDNTNELAVSLPKKDATKRKDAYPDLA